MLIYRLSRKNRGVRFVLAILFAALTLAAGGPHEHDRDGKGGGSSAIAVAGHAAAPSSPCPLCEWATESYSLPASGLILTSPVALPLSSAPVAKDEYGFRLPVLHRSLRAPPSSEIA